MGNNFIITLTTAAVYKLEYLGRILITNSLRLI